MAFKKTYQITCDNEGDCNCVFSVLARSEEEASWRAEKEGWYAVSVGKGVWVHLCPKCKPAPRGTVGKFPESFTGAPGGNGMPWDEA